MNRATNIFALTMMDNVMVKASIVQETLAGVIIGRDQADFMGHGFIHEVVKGLGINIINHSGHDLTATAHSPNNRSLAGRTTAPAPLIPMLILGLAANKGFIDFHKTNEFAKFLIGKTNPDSMAHRPSRTIRPCADHSMDLQSTHTLFAAQHKVDYLEPSLQGIIGVLENGSHQDRKAITSCGTTTLPVEGPVKFIDLFAAAPWAPDPERPAPSHHISFTGIFIREHGCKFGQGHLPNSLFVHGKYPLTFDDHKIAHKLSYVKK
jgi:hypothetical protein